MSDSAGRPPARRPGRSAVAALFFLSGAASLVFELAWLGLFVNVFGHTTYSTSAVLAAFMGGLALGGIIFGRRSERSADPWRLYGAIELGAGISGALVPLLAWAMVPLYGAVFALAPDTGALLTAVKFAASFATMLVPATLMGGTLPVLAGLIPRGRSGSGAGGWISALYAVNTAGAVAGTLAGGLGLIPAVGLVWTGLAAAGVDVAIGCVVLSGLLGRAPDPEERADAPAAEALPARSGVMGARVLLVASAASGFASLGCEVIWTRLLVFVTESTVYALTTILATFLAGIALGAALARLLLRRGLSARRTFAVTLALSAFAVFATIFLFGSYPRVVGPMRAFVGNDWDRLCLASALAASAVMLPGAILFGMSFPAAAAAYAEATRGLSRPVGALAAWNTLGAAAGSAAAGLVLAGALGSKGTMEALAALLALAAGAVGLTDGALSMRARRSVLLASVAAASAAVCLAPGGALDGFFNSAEPRPDECRLLGVSEGPGGIVTVHHYGSRGVRVISANGVNVAGTAHELRSTQRLQAALPVLLHGRPARVLQVGYGSGETSRVLVAAGIPRVDVVEISPEIIGVAAEYFGVVNGGVEMSPRLHPIIMDGANLVRLTRERYDLIMNDSIWPHLPGCSGLYTREYFADAREHLAPGGIMTSWLPLELSEEAFATVIATFRSAFPHSTLWAMSAGQSKHALIVGTPEPLHLDAGEIARRIDEFGLREELAAVGIGSAEDLLGAMLLDEEALATLAAGAETSSRDRPILEFMVSRRRGAGARTRMAANLRRIAGAIGDADGARSARREMVLRTATELEESVRAEPLAGEGDSAYNARRYADAAGAYSRALEVAPNDWRLHLRLGRALTFSGRAEEALRSYRRSAELRPFETEAWWALVACAPPEEAARAYQRVRALDPSSAEKLRFVRPELAR